MRNWNRSSFNTTGRSCGVYRVPMRNWNMFASTFISIMLILFIACLWGIETVEVIYFPYFNIDCLSRAYEELKLLIILFETFTIRRLSRAYEELKQRIDWLEGKKKGGLSRAYEELKQSPPSIVLRMITSLSRAYEELKRDKNNTNRNYIYWFIACLWRIETRSNAGSSWLGWFCLSRAYEELKPSFSIVSWIVFLMFIACLWRIESMKQYNRV